MLGFASLELVIMTEAADSWLAVKISVLPMTFIKVSWIPGYMESRGCMAFVA